MGTATETAPEPLRVEAGEDKLHVEARIRGIREAAAGSAPRAIVELISEGFGNAANNHYYDAALIEQVAPLFEGAKMYSNHLSKKDKADLGGLPRKWEQLVGRLKRTWTERLADGRMALLGEAEVISDRLLNVLRKAPDIVGVSIDAVGTDKREMREGRPANVVTSIRRVGSLDVVSEAGARGRFRELLEADGLDDFMEAVSDADNVTDERFAELLEAATEEEQVPDEPEADPAAEDQPTDAPVQPEQPETPAEPAQPTEPETPAEEPAPAAAEVQEASAAEIEAALDRDTRRVETAVLPGQRTPERRHASVDTLLAGLSEADRDLVEGEIEARARALAAERLTPAIQEAVQVARAGFDTELAEALADRDERHERDLAKRDQRWEASALIDEAARRPTGALKLHTARELKEEFYDAFYADDQGQPDPAALREAVAAAIDERTSEAKRFAVRGVPSSAEVSVHEGRSTAPARQRGGAPGRLADDLDRKLNA